MAWYWILTLGFLVGFTISNAKFRHHVINLIIFTSKAVLWSFKWILKGTELMQNKLDNVKVKAEYKKSLTKTRTAKPETINFETATDEQIREYIQQHPENIRVKARVGD